MHCTFADTDYQLQNSDALNICLVKADRHWQDSEFANAFKHSDEQNAKITFEEVLKRKLIDHIETNFEVFKEFNDNKEFRDFFAGTMFKLMQKDFLRFNATK